MLPTSLMPHISMNSNLKLPDQYHACLFAVGRQTNTDIYFVDTSDLIIFNII